MGMHTTRDECWVGGSTQGRRGRKEAPNQLGGGEGGLPEEVS